jgi:hypothetical protein
MSQATHHQQDHWSDYHTANIENVEFPTLRVPSDICSDDYGHIYVSGQYSHNIHRFNIIIAVHDLRS